jgi:cytochrome c oxidase cbb3-type subunit IV
MYKDILQNIDHIAIWPVISFIIFFTFFLGLLWWVFTADKNFMNEMGRKPLQEGSENSNDVEPLNR